MADELTPEQSRELVAVMARPGYAEEFERLGVRVMKTFGGVHVHVPPEHRALVLSRVAAARSGGEPRETKDDLLGGEPYLKSDYEAAAKLRAAEKLTVRGIMKGTDLLYTRAYRIYRQFMKGAVLCDEDGRPTPGPGYQFEAVDLDGRPGRRLIEG